MIFDIGNTKRKTEVPVPDAQVDMVLAYTRLSFEVSGTIAVLDQLITEMGVPVGKTQIFLKVELLALQRKLRTAHAEARAFAFGSEPEKEAA